MMQNIASQILNTPSETQAPVNAELESSETTAVSEQKPQSNDFDEKLGILAKMERKIKEKEGMFKQKETEWEENRRKLQEYEEFMQLFEENPLEALKKRKGWGVQEFNEFAVKNASDEDLDPVAQMKKEFMAQLEEKDKSWEQKFNERIEQEKKAIQEKDHEIQIREFKSNIKSFLAENKDDFEFINAEENGMDHVYDLIVEDIQRQKKEAEEKGVENPDLKIMDIKEAATKVEEFLDKTYSKYLSLKKVRSKFNPEMEFTERLGGIISKSEPSTLNSNFSPKSKGIDQSSKAEREQAAIELLKSMRQNS